MRRFGTSILVTLLGASFAIACSVTSEDSGESADAISAREQLALAKASLRILGAPQVQQDPGNHGSCSFTGCHSINTVTVRKWSEQYKAVVEVLESSRPAEEKINYFRQNPQNAETLFTPERVGILAAGSHLALGANVDKDLHPETYKQGQMLEELFRGKEELYAEFRREMLMPVLEQYPRLTPTDYETVLKWFKMGTPKLADVIRETRPTECVDDFAALAARTSQVKGETWAATNQAKGMPMFGCPAPNLTNPVSATECFKNVREGADVFPTAAATTWARGWALQGSTVRILRQLTSPNSFWLRSSADGRFAATGGGRRAGAQAVDLQANLAGRKRDIGLDASYDPDFWPDNKAFMFQGGTKFCSQSLLEKASTTLVKFNEPECSNLEAASGLYQTVGQVNGSNSMGDRFILYSIWAGDSGQYSAQATDTEPSAGSDSGIEIYTAVALGNDMESGYEIKGNAFQIKTPYRGDTMMGRSGRLLGSRWAYASANRNRGAAGYAIEKLDFTPTAGGYEFTLSPLGTVCLKGNKANFSFDERFLATHHYNERADFADNETEYHAKGSSDLIVADFITGKKETITKMGPGQFALYPHFRSDGWLYFLVVDANTQKYYVAASDWAVRSAEAAPTP